MQKAAAAAPSNTEIKEDLAMAYNDYGVSFGKKGDHKQEILYLSRAAKLLPENKIIQENLDRAKQKAESKEPKKEPAPEKKKTR